MRTPFRIGALIVALALPPSAARPATAPPHPSASAPHSSAVRWTPEEIAALRTRFDALLADPVLGGAHLGALFVSTADGTTLYARNDTDEFVPASNFKLLIGSVALDKLGPTFTFRTSVLADGTIHARTLHGNLYLRGGGDAHLSVADLAAAADAVAFAGIRRIDGALITDASLFAGRRYPPGWVIDDLPYYYAAPISALSLDENVVHVRVAPGATVGAPVLLSVVPATDALHLENRAVTGPRGSAETLDLERPAGDLGTIRIVGSYPLGAPLSDDLAPAVPDPPRYAGDLFRQLLRARGIIVNGGIRNGVAPPHARVLWQHDSAPLAQMLAQMWLPSDNLMAELLLRALGIIITGPPGTMREGFTVERLWLRDAGIDPATVALADGSGLSIYDRITPDDLVAILQHDWNSPYRDVVLDALPVAGVRGTLRDAYRGTPAAGAVYAKTGTMTHVSAISGYVMTATHGPVTFSLLLDDWVPRVAHPDEALARVRAALFSYLAQQ
jgi:D-alanyl-D-alanine carboxypeptidase/D-alanyl-D-alanine-endopeptidase (penicillin-binding protein 4)